MKHPIFMLASCFFFIATSAQLPDTDIFLSQISKSGDAYSFSSPVNMTKRKGYDNQPSFTADGNAFFFVSINQDTTQSDIYKADLVEKKVSRITSTKESEYSPVLTPDKNGISVVRVDADSGQRFYIIPVNDFKVANHVDHSDSIGYYAWTSDTTIAMFVLGGASNSLQSLNIKSGKRTFITNSIGRCMKTDRNRRFLYFTDKSDSSKVSVCKMDLTTEKISRIATAIKGSEDFELLPDGSILMGSKGKLYRQVPGSDSWSLQADFTSVLSDFYRLVLDPTGRLLALVAYTGEKP
jgi:hypothetical protein